ncbi:MAG TPA: MotA/TolQ/ExbB proton channel family protein [Candidatus Hydrogenedentes bacterium]|nr:MotA/TolQ/ExbB proton channel family protein [Candidatus Hydrogenedentota bacterium]HQE81842.1 MotA/TolQ/ExbB proton channel family protein [Candidatus Hydrogenedentota bacterium]HQH50867.1 MotA/TolQ/ExbB proton channel family protein [Candidatus Hydrogenedentota bacterium]HQM48685.1 MotA/TolQ/ExbB proton channel family protein [Candidatus Hydrogenedentota bacterium]
MDIATLVGLISGITLVVVSILMGGHPGVFWSASSVVIVVGGTLASTLINFPLGDVLSVLNTVKNAFFHKETPPENLIPKLVGFATIARREGILALESHAGEAGDEFLERSVQLAIDGTAPELIKDILTTELAFMEDRHAMGQAILLAMGTFAPAFGMIGTLIGMVQMFVTLDDPSKIGEGMAVAVLTTLYGALLANVVFLPAAGKLKVRTSNELLAKELVIEGILSIQSGDNPRVVEQKLKAFVSPAVRRQVSSR